MDEAARFRSGQSPSRTDDQGPAYCFGQSRAKSDRPLDLHETERRLISQALASTNGNITAAAKKLGISRRTLHRKINEMNAEKNQAAKAELDTAPPERETPRLASDR